MKINAKIQLENDQQHHHNHFHHHHHPPHLKLGGSLMGAAQANSVSGPGSQQVDVHDEDSQSPPLSPLRLPQLSSSNSSISSWSSSSQGSQSSDDVDLALGSSQCNSKEERSTYNTKFAKYHLETFKQNDRMRWNFDFDHNRPLDDSHHNHHQAVARYQWEPTI